MNNKSKKIWLFAFADLAFLLLIAFTQIPNGTEYRFMKAPNVISNKNLVTAPTYKLHLELIIDQILKTNDKAPYQLLLIRNNKVEDDSKKFSRDELFDKLKEWQIKYKIKPLIIPDKHSFTQDTFYAMSQVDLLWENWKGPESIIVKPIQPSE